jgi:hypothetical protein
LKIKLNFKMNKWTKLFIILSNAFVLAIITFIINSAYIAKNTNLKPVVVATKNIGPFEEVIEFTVVKKVASSIPEDAITEPIDLKGKPWFAGKIGIGQGDIIRISRITEVQTNPFGNVIALKKNKVLVGVKTDLVMSAGRNLKPGTLVHGNVFIKGNDRNTFDRVISSQNDPLLANLLVREVQNSDAAKLSEKGREALPAVVVLEASIPVAQKLIFYQEIGKIYLTPSAIDMETALFSEITNPAETKTNKN